MGREIEHRDVQGGNNDNPGSVELGSDLGQTGDQGRVDGRTPYRKHGGSNRNTERFWRGGKQNHTGPRLGEDPPEADQLLSGVPYTECVRSPVERLHMGRVGSGDSPHGRQGIESVTHPGTVEDIVSESILFLQSAEGEGSELAQYASRIVQMSQNIIPAEIRHGEVKLPKRARNTDVLPMIAVPSGTKFKLERSFEEPTPTQMAFMLRAIHRWDPIKGSDEVMLTNLLWRSKSTRVDRVFQSIGGVDNITSDAPIYGSDFHQVKGGNVARIGGRPLIVIRYGALASPVAFGHEMAHVNQLNNRALSLNNERNEDMMSMEFEAYHVGALIGRAMQHSGHHLRQIDLRQIDIDNIRLHHASGPQDYRPTQALLSDLRTAGLLQFVDHR